MSFIHGRTSLFGFFHRRRVQLHASGANELHHEPGSVFGTPLRSLKALFPSTQCSECSGCETECMTIDKFYWPLSLEPDKQEDTKLSEAKKFIVRNNEASACLSADRRPATKGSSENAVMACWESSGRRSVM